MTDAPLGNGNVIHTWEQAVEWLRVQPGREDFVRQCYYDDPLLAAAARFCASEEWAGICKLLEGWIPGRVLEMGAGRGTTSFAFASVGCDVTALEPDPSPIVGCGAIDELNKSLPNPIRILTQWGERIDVPDQSFDIVFCRATLHHAHDINAFCKEAARVLRPGGVFLAEREHILDKKEDLSKFQDAHPLHHLYGGEMAYTLKEYHAGICKAGLKLKRSIHPYGHVVNLIPPMSGPRFRQMTREAIVKFKVPRVVAKWLGDLSWVRQLYGETLNWRNRVPGRMFSFLATKPGQRL